MPSGLWSRAVLSAAIACGLTMLYVGGYLVVRETHEWRDGPRAKDRSSRTLFALTGIDPWLMALYKPLLVVDEAWLGRGHGVRRW